MITEKIAPYINYTVGMCCAHCVFARMSRQTVKLLAFVNCAQYLEPICLYLNHQFPRPP